MGETGTVTILHRVKLDGGYKPEGRLFTIDRSETFSYDFGGTTFEVVVEPALTVLGTAVVDGDWQATYRCDAETRQIVTFRVMAGAKVRYQDRTWVRCYAAP